MIKKTAIELILVAILLLVSGLASSCSPLEQNNYEPLSEVAEYYQPAPTPGADLDAIEADADINIPSNASEIYAMISGFREPDTWVRFDIRATELSAFLDETLCETPLVSVNPKTYTPGELDPDWWQPQLSMDLVECHGGNDFARQYVLVDRTKSQVFTIYVFDWTDDFTTPTPTP